MKVHEKLESLLVPIDSIVEDPVNTRGHDERNLEAIGYSLKRFGQRSPIVVQKEGMRVRAGNGSLRAAKALGWTHIAAIVVDESDVESTIYSIADNRSSDLGEWAVEKVADHMGYLSDEEIEGLGFDKSFVDEFLGLGSLDPITLEGVGSSDDVDRKHQERLSIRVKDLALVETVRDVLSKELMEKWPDKVEVV